MEYNWLTFCGIAALMTITPGADTVIVTKNAIASGRRAAFFTTLGVCSGLLIHALASSLGLSVILNQSADLYHAVKLLGAGYLIYLGGRTLWSAWHRTATMNAMNIGGDDAGPERGNMRGFSGYFAQGLLNNVLNPKVAIFYLTMLPQFIDTSSPALPQALGLACIHIAQGLVWLGLCGYFVSSMRQAFSKPKIWRRIESLSGAVLVAFGLTLALDER